jgi:hypothetical protein
MTAQGKLAQRAPPWVGEWPIGLHAESVRQMPKPHAFSVPNTDTESPERRSLRELALGYPAPHLRCENPDAPYTGNPTAFISAIALLCCTTPGCIR